MLDLLGIIMLIFGYFLSGPPDDWHHYTGFGVKYVYGTTGSSVVLTFSWDPTPIRYRPPPEWFKYNPPEYCGFTDGWNVWVYPTGQCKDTLKHELAHISQRRSVGPLGMLIASMLEVNLEPPKGSWYDGMWNPKGDGFSLFRLEIPVAVDEF